MRYEIRYFKRSDGRYPFREWLAALKDHEGAAQVRKRILRLAGGNPGDSKSVGEGVHELRISTGPGYRAYFGYDGGVAVLLLVGGDKSTQDRDIEKAKSYWKEYRSSKP